MALKEREKQEELAKLAKEQQEQREKERQEQEEKLKQAELEKQQQTTTDASAVVKPGDVANKAAEGGATVQGDSAIDKGVEGN